MHTGDVVALVGVRAVRGVPHGAFPVLGVGSRDDDSREDLLGAGRWDGRVVDLDHGAGGDERFEHGCGVVMFKK